MKFAVCREAVGNDLVLITATFVTGH